MIDYELFKDVVKEKILDYLPPEYQDSEISIHPVDKFNRAQPYDGMVVAKKGEQVCPIIDLNAMYHNYQITNNLDTIMRGFCEIVLEAYDRAKENRLDPDFNIREHIVPEIGNSMVNAQRLKDSPSRRLNDLSVSYRVSIKDGEKGSASIHINNDYALRLGMDENELYKLACDNMKRLYPPETTRLVDYIYSSLQEKGMSDEEIEVMLGGPIQGLYESSPWLVRNHSANGATVLLDNEVFDELANYVDDDLVIIPSSIYEVLAVEASMIPDREELSAFIKSVNINEVDENERLSNQVYMYSREDKQIRMVTNSQSLSVAEEQDNQYTADKEVKGPGI